MQMTNLEFRNEHAPVEPSLDRILVVEDDVDVRETVRMMLLREGFAVEVAGSLREAEAVLARCEITLAIVDLLLSGEDGLKLVRSLASTPSTAVVIMSGKSHSTDRIIGIEVGADDYITKPFNSRELIARVKRHATRIRALYDNRGPVSAPSGSPMSIGQWMLDESRHAVVNASGVQANLSDSEFRTLACLLRNRGSVLTRDELFNHVVGPCDRDPMDRRIDVHVSSIRKKLKLDSRQGIRTVHRVGYIID
ncbi:response regulator transcription factor [Acuticoccus sp. M5D2P5]|uniref:response regulator transcription factor n=1 Tax=Acuticoccus kalidii TaxID=2910977 RepID=UPI001F2EF63E|nr:response regulator transcription factor [Acuticoccus kalidii]MCF3933018.1 response regulator transcription factor [Acuticoccus kalidii]